MATNIVLADDHPIVRIGVRSLLERVPDCTVIGEARDGLEAVGLVLKLHPEILILDPFMPKLNGMQVIDEVKRKSPRTRIIVLTTYDHSSYVTESMRRGAYGYVLKDSLADDIVNAVDAVASGRQFLSERLARSAGTAADDASASGTFGGNRTLTAREQDILFLIAGGHTNKEIAGRFDISVRTVETHRASIKRKLGIRSHAGLIHYATTKNALLKK